MEETKYRMVEYLDEPERILFFTIDEFLSLMIPIAMGIKTHHLLLGLLAGIALVSLIHKLKANDSHAFVQRMLYWYFPPQLSKVKHISPSCYRSFIG